MEKRVGLPAKPFDWWRDKMPTRGTRFVARRHERPGMHAASFASVRVAAVGLAFADFPPYLDHVEFDGIKYPVMSLGAGWRTGSERLDACQQLANAVAERVPGPVEVDVDGEIYIAEVR